MKKLITDVLKILLYSSLILLTAAFVLLFVLPYTTFKDNISFLAFKQQYIHIPIWKISFYIHVFSAFLALLSGIPQFSNTVLTKFKSVHRILGQVYAYDILVVNFPTGMVLAVTAIGPWISKLGFVVLDCLWWFFTFKAVTAIRNHDVFSHKNFMMRSYALTFSAITLRVWSTIFISILHFNPLIVYSINAWMGFIPNLLFVEILIWRSRRRRFFKRRFKTIL
ncbi:DUF2306 domain-containing protein [Chitinophaga sp.]|uniref:DUF2306 domain-containing protein n=1 Tax=Chitinophaga sp. TaxID=1869181 RepID=UPI0031D0EE65